MIVAGQYPTYSLYMSPLGCLARAHIDVVSRGLGGSQFWRDQMTIQGVHGTYTI